MTQKFFERALLLLAILCLLIIFQINFFQLHLNWFDFDNSLIERTNSILMSLTTSFIAGYIFYVINIQIATVIRKRKTTRLIENYLIDLVTQIEIGQLYLKRTYFKNHDFASLSETDFAPIQKLDNTSRINFRYNQINTLGQRRQCSTGTFTETDLFYEERELVKSNIQTIFSFPYISDLDYELINILYKIQSSLFYIGVQHIKNGITYLNFNTSIYEHYLNCIELKKFVTPRETT